MKWPKLAKNLYMSIRSVGPLEGYSYREVSEMVEGRCMKCKGPVEIKNPEDVIMKNGMKAVKGTCPKCSTKVFRIVGKA